MKLDWLIKLGMTLVVLASVCIVMGWLWLGIGFFLTIFSKMAWYSQIINGGCAAWSTYLIAKPIWKKKDE